MTNNYNYTPKKVLGYSDFIKKIYGYDIDTANITFQVTEDCCLACTYCYQNHKTKNKMDFDTGKKLIDQLLSNQYPTVNTNNTKGIILEFIGGEPLLEINLIEKLVDYYFTQVILLQHPWAYHTRISLCSNGILYFSSGFQNFLKKYQQILSLTISIDGNEKLHDSCRIDKQGKGSYQQAIAAVRDYIKKFNTPLQNKMTLAPENISFLKDSIENLINEGYKDIFLNCVFEDVWNLDHAKELYKQLIQVANFLIDNNLYNKIYLSIFDEDIGHPMLETENSNWCGGNVDDQGGFAIDYKGDFYPCIRYMESSLNGKQRPLNIGSINHGWVHTEEEKYNAELLSNVTRRSCSTDECFNCPIAEGCAWCSGYNYEEFGTPKSRATYICLMHQARVLANYYYWAKIQKKIFGTAKIKLFLPKELALQFIDEQEYNNFLLL